MSILEGMIPNAIWDGLKLAAGYAKGKFTANTASSHWIPRLNAYLSGKAHVYSAYTQEPLVTVMGPFELNESLRTATEDERRKIAQRGRPNDPHAILIEEPQWLSDPPLLRTKVLDFAGISAMRNAGEKPEVISSSAVIVCKEEKVLLLHERASDVATYPGYFHTMGGAYLPPGTGGVDADRARTRTTIVREVLEEAQIALSGDQFPPLMMAKELETGFIQSVFLGFSVTPRMLGHMEGNWEGTPHRVSFEKLPAFFRQAKMVPSGKAHLLAWLAMGAPNASNAPQFSGMRPQQLFDAIVAT